MLPSKQATAAAERTEAFLNWVKWRPDCVESVALGNQLAILRCLAALTDRQEQESRSMYAVPTSEHTADAER